MTQDLRQLNHLVLKALNARVREGHVSERQLARIAGYSQPHVHNVLHGKRGLQPETGDALLSAASLTLEDALRREPETGSLGADVVAVPRLEGGLGSGRRFPRLPRRPRLEHFAGIMLEGLSAPAVSEIAGGEESMFPWLWPGDKVILETAAESRRRPRLESIYALEHNGIGYVGRCQRLGERLLVVTDSDTEGPRPPQWVDMADLETPTVVRGRIVWVGRRLDKRHIYLVNASLQSEPEGR